MEPYEALRRLRKQFVDPKVGIIREMGEVRREADDPLFFYAGARASNTSAFAKQGNFSSGGGASVSRDLAFLKSIGESIERYCAAIYDSGELPLFAYHDRGERKCCDPDSWALFSTRQYKESGFPFVPFTADTPIRWKEGSNMGTGDSIFVPASSVFVPYTYYSSEGDSPIQQPISTGLACHITYEQAAISALCEVIERDAFMLYWLLGLSLPSLCLSSLSPFANDLIARFDRIGCDITLKLVALDIPIPTIIAICRKRNLRNGPETVVAAACAPNIEDAVRKALEELAHTRRYVKEILRTKPRIDNDFQITNQEDHLNFWINRSLDKLAPWATEGASENVKMEDIEPISGPDKCILSRMIKLVENAGYVPVVINLTTTDIKDYLHVVRVVVPGLQPLVMGSSTAPHGGRRLQVIPSLCRVNAKYSASLPNPLPHPFP